MTALTHAAIFPSKSRWVAWLAAISFVFLSFSSAQAQSSDLSSVEKAKVHLLLSQMGNSNMRAMGGGGYAYADAKTNPYGHFKSDIHPWIMMGARRGDSPNPKGRIKAYVKDLESGLIAANDVWPTLTETDISAAGTKDLPIVWEKVLEDEKAKEILDLIGGENEVTADSAKKPLKAVRKRLQKLY